MQKVGKQWISLEDAQRNAYELMVKDVEAVMEIMREIDG